MLASSPTPSRSLSGVSGLGITSGEGVPAERWLTLAFSNKLQFQHRRRRLSEEQSSDHSQQGIGGLGHAVLTAPQVKPRAQNSTSSTKSSNTDQQRHKQQSSKQEDRQPSGADVLLALRWASARKSNKKRKEFPRSSPGKSSPCATDNEEDTTGYSNVRPISIRSDWTTRLDELDKHLQDVIESTL
ncbi:hypothetical protein NMG60_11028855 [Bertholletia excelsa]